MPKSVKQSIVLDSNVLVSRLLFPASTSGRAVKRALDHNELLLSSALLNELVDVLSRPKFDRYVTIANRTAFLRAIYLAGKIVVVAAHVQACRDPKDNMILELDLAGHEDLIVTGDKDLLSLGTFQNIPIITPATYVQYP